MIDTPLTDPEPSADDPGHDAWEARRKEADTHVDPSSHEGLLRRIAHAWRRFESAPSVDQGKLAAAIGDVVAEHEANGGTPADDAKVANLAAVVKAEKNAEVVAKAAEGDEQANVVGVSTLPGAPKESPEPEPEPAPEPVAPAADNPAEVTVIPTQTTSDTPPA